MKTQYQGASLIYSILFAHWITWSPR